MNTLEKFVKSHTGETREMLESFVHTFADTIKEKRRLEQKVEMLAYELRFLKKKLFGSRSEKASAATLALQDDVNLFNEFELVVQTLPSEEPALPLPPETTSPSSSQKTGRKPLPATLPRVVIEHDLPEEAKQCG